MKYRANVVFPLPKDHFKKNTSPGLDFKARISAISLVLLRDFINIL